MQEFDEEPLDLSTLTKVDYSPLMLNVNPFPAMGLPEEIPLTTSDRKDIIARFREALRQTIFEDKTVITTVTGDFGAGKSHLLKYFKQRVNTQLLSSSNKVLAVYVKSIGRNFKDVYLYFIDDIGREFLTEYAVQLIRAYIEKKPASEIRRYLHDKTLLSEEKLSSIRVERIVKGLMFYDFIKDMRENSFSGVRSNLLNPLLSLAHPDYAPIAWRWFVGESLNKDEREVIKVDVSIDDARNAQSAFTGLISLFLQGGFNGIVLLIDELEKLTLIPKNLRDLYMDEIRYFLDDHTSGLCVVITVTPTALSELTEIESALSRRLSGTEFPLKFFTKLEIQELINRYLQIGRRGKEKDILEIPKRFPKVSPSLFPFTNDAINRIDHRSKGLVSTVINLCRESIELAIQSKLEVIDADLIDSIRL